MKRFVIDASVALKWCLPLEKEDFVAEAEALLTSFRNNEVAFFVPDLFWLEIENALWKAVLKGRVLLSQAEKGFAKITDLGIPTVPSFDLVPQALELAVAHSRSVYDSTYVVLALKANANLVTADERLANALAARFPVKWLGAL